MTEQKRGGSNKYTRIYALGPDRVQQIDTMLIKNTTAEEVARVITEDWGFYADERPALTKQITRYRTEYIDASLKARADHAEKTQQGRLMVQLRTDQLNVLEDMLDVIIVQKGRINKALELEEKMPIIQATVKFELKLLFDMYKLYSQIQLETGVLRRAPKTISGSFHLDEEAGMLQFEAEMRTNSDLRKAIKDVIQILEGEFESVPDDDRNNRGPELPCLERTVRDRKGGPDDKSSS